MLKVKLGTFAVIRASSFKVNDDVPEKSIGPVGELNRAQGQHNRLYSARVADQDGASKQISSGGPCFTEETNILPQ